MTSRDVINWDELPETELMAFYFTSPKEMEGASSLRQHDNVHKQITAFEKLLQHSINRFSTDKLHQMFRLLLAQLSSAGSVSSLGRLRELVGEFREETRRGIAKDEQGHVVKYFDTFFDDISYLKSLKRYFDERIYLCLYDYFYEPESDLLEPREVLDRERRGRVSFDDGKDSGNSSLRGSDDGKVGEDAQAEAELEVYFDRLLDDEKLSMSVRKMFQLNDRWGELFLEGDIDPGLFDADSKHEILQFANYDRFELILRLVPDIFVKAYKSIEVAKLWWTQANKLHEGRPRHLAKAKSERDINAKVFTLEKKVSGLRDEIRLNEDLLLMQNDELQNLQDREKRYVSLSEQCEMLEDKKNLIGDQYNKLLQHRDQLKRHLDRLDPHTTQYRQAIQLLGDCERKFFDAQIELRMLSFQFQLVQSDFLTELDLRPDMLRFQTDTQTKIDDTKKIIWSKNEEIRGHEKRLTLLRTNCERMRAVVRKYLRSHVEKPDDGKKLKKRQGEEKRDLPKENTLAVSAPDPDWDYYSDPPRRDGRRHKRTDKAKDKADSDSRAEDGNEADTETPTPGYYRTDDRLPRSRERPLP